MHKVFPTFRSRTRASSEMASSDSISCTIHTHLWRKRDAQSQYHGLLVGRYNGGLIPLRDIGTYSAIGLDVPVTSDTEQISP
jgi:hypothetical protein